MTLDLSNARFAFLDLETTGLSPWFGDRICEVGIVVSEGKRIRTTYQQLVNPERPLSPGAASTNGLKDSDLVRAPTFQKVSSEILTHIQDAIVVCHNAQFDMQFLDSEFRRIGYEIQISNLIDTLFVARENFDLPSYSLNNVANAFKIQNPQAHRALADALTTKGILFAMLDVLKASGMQFDRYIGLYNSPAWPRDGIGLPTQMGEAIYSGKRLLLKYIDRDGEQTERWVTPMQVLGLSDYIYLRGYCHLRKSERTFRLDRIVSMSVENEK